MVQVKDKKKTAGDGSTLASVLEKKSAKIPFEVMDEERLPGSRIRFKLKLDPQDFEVRLQDTLKDVGRQVSIPGFRPGKAPKMLVRKSYEPAAREEAVKKIIPRLAELFAAERNIEPLSQAILLDMKTKKGEDVIVELALEYHPEITITDETLAGLDVKIHELQLDDAYVEHSLQQLREKTAVYEPTDEAYQKHDGMLLTCVVTDAENVRLVDRCATDYYTTKIEDEMPAAVAEALVGKSKGDRLELEVDEEGEKINYDVKVLEVKRRVLPDLDDDFATDVNDDFETLDQLRAHVKEDAQRKEDARQREETLMEAFTILRGRLDFDLPRALVESTTRKSIGEMEERLNQYGMSLNQMDEQIVRNYAISMQEQAKLNVKNHLMLKAIAKHLGVTASDEEIKDALKKMADRLNRKPLAVRAQLEARKEWDSFVEDLTLKLTNDRLLKNIKTKKTKTTIAEFEASARKRQEDQAAKLRGEFPTNKELDLIGGEEAEHDHDHENCDHDHSH